MEGVTWRMAGHSWLVLYRLLMLLNSFFFFFFFFFFLILTLYCITEPCLFYFVAMHN
jgi:hypothetical protein